MKLKKGQFVIIIKDVEKYIERLYERRAKKFKKVLNGYGDSRLKQWQECKMKIENAEMILESMRAAKVAQVDPTLTQSIPAHPQQ